MITDEELEEFFREQDIRMNMSDDDNDEYLARLSQRLSESCPTSATDSYVNFPEESQEHPAGYSCDSARSIQHDGRFKRKQPEQSGSNLELESTERKRKQPRLAQFSDEEHPSAPVVPSTTNLPDPLVYDEISRQTSPTGSMMVGGPPRPTIFSHEVVPSSDPGEQSEPSASDVMRDIEEPQATGKDKADLKNREEVSVKQNRKRPMDQAEDSSITKMRETTRFQRVGETKLANPSVRGAETPPKSNAIPRGGKKQESPILIKRGKINKTEERNDQRGSDSNSRTTAPPKPKAHQPQVEYSLSGDSIESIKPVSKPVSKSTIRSDPSVPLFPEAKGKVSSHASARQRDKVIKIQSRAVSAGNISTPSNSTSVIEDPSSSSFEQQPLAGPSKTAIQPKKRQPISSTVTTPASSNPLDPRSSPSPVEKQPKKSKVDSAASAKTKPKEKKAKEKKVKPQLMTPLEYAQKLQEKIDFSSLAGKPKKFKYLKGKKIFYTGGDMQYAGARTRGRMDFIVRHGGTLLPTYDPSVVTHIVTDAHRAPTVRALGLRNLKEIPDHIPTVTWSWILSGLGKAPLRSGGKGTEGKGDEEDGDEEFYMDDVCMHASFLERFDAGRPEGPPKGKGKSKANDASSSNGEGKAIEEGSEFSRISEFTQDKPLTRSQSPALHVAAKAVVQGEASTSHSSAQNRDIEDPLAEFYALAKTDRDNAWANGEDEEPEAGSSDDESDERVTEFARLPVPKRGFACDNKEVQRKSCVNQDVVDKLEELMELHKCKPSEEDGWRAFSYGKCLRALRNYPERIKSYAEARSIRGVGEKTALKIMEILQTGELRRIGYEKTDDVEATHAFQGIYGVGRQTAFKWYASGCRTLDDVRARKGGIKLTTCQEIGIRFYDDINTRMPRSEAEAIFNAIKPRALALDPKLFIEIMGSFRRGKADCGDIDILITRPIEDGKTHAGVLKNLIQDLHTIGILTEDLSLPEDWDDLEACYRGLCRLPVKNSLRRRIDILAVPWTSRGAALLYYTGDDIFNRAIRYKAGVMGYSLNQKGLFGGVVRDPRNRRVKLNDGAIIASETEEEIFKILGVPWQEPHERVRG